MLFSLNDVDTVPSAERYFATLGWQFRKAFEWDDRTWHVVPWPETGQEVVNFIRFHRPCYDRAVAFRECKTIEDMYGESNFHDIDWYLNRLWNGGLFTAKQFRPALEDLVMVWLTRYGPNKLSAALALPKRDIRLEVVANWFKDHPLGPFRDEDTLTDQVKKGVTGECQLLFSAPLADPFAIYKELVKWWQRPIGFTQQAGYHVTYNVMWRKAFAELLIPIAKEQITLYDS